MIHRNRKPKHKTPVVNQPYPSTRGRSDGSPGTNGSSLESHLAIDIAVTRERLGGLGNSQHNPLGALSSLSEACAAVWQDEAEFVETGNEFFLFEDHAVSWVKCKPLDDHFNKTTADTTCNSIRRCTRSGSSRVKLRASGSAGSLASMSPTSSA